MGVEVAGFAGVVEAEPIAGSSTKFEADGAPVGIATMGLMSTAMSRST